MLVGNAKVNGYMHNMILEVKIVVIMNATRTIKAAKTPCLNASHLT
jgi:hypothetical protein